MKLEISTPELNELVARQLRNLFMFNDEQEFSLLSRGVEEALKQCEVCFTNADNKYYHRDGEVYFNPFHSGQYAIFLYYLSSNVCKLSPDDTTLADRIYYLNKALNGLDLFYRVEMPKVFYLSHPVGSVIGRATYGEGFSFKQNCTVGNNKTNYPNFGKNVRMMSGSKVLGKCNVGDNVIISANTYIKDTDIPSLSLVFGSSPNLIIKPISRNYDMYQ